MSISLCVLGSGSSGNCTLVVLRDGVERQFVLIDAGLSPRRTRWLLANIGVPIDRISSIILTHLDSDHFRPTWISVAQELGIEICLHESHAATAPFGAQRTGRLRPMNGSLRLGAKCRLRSIRLPHDEAGTFGFVIEHAGTRLGYATDLGHVPDTMLEAFRDLHALAIESNYDHELELASARPWFLKQRVMGDHGHLSNDQCLEAVRKIEQQSTLSHIVLLHLSRQCNCPRIVQRMYGSRAPDLINRLTISSQHAPTHLLHVNQAPGMGGMTGMTGDSLFSFAAADAS